MVFVSNGFSYRDEVPATKTSVAKVHLPPVNSSIRSKFYLLHRDQIKYQLQEQTEQNYLPSAEQQYL
jgi:hypothetical protein